MCILLVWEKIYYWRLQLPFGLTRLISSTRPKFDV